MSTHRIKQSSIFLNKGSHLPQPHLGRVSALAERLDLLDHLPHLLVVPAETHQFELKRLDLDVPLQVEQLAHVLAVAAPFPLLLSLHRSIRFAEDHLIIPPDLNIHPSCTLWIN